VRRTARLLLFAFTAIGVLLLFVFPARTLINQRRDIASTQSHISALTQENSRLAARAKSLSGPATIEQIAHQDYGLVMPGQQAYTILPKASSTSTATSASSASGGHAHHHWWQDLEFWKS
jgi:cell division protein FtsB